MASDTFTDSNGTALTTHDSNWGDAAATPYPVSNIDINSNCATRKTSNGGARYTTSSSLNSEFVLAARASTDSQRPGLIVRAEGSGNNFGYCAELIDSGSTGTWTGVVWRKNNVYKSQYNFPSPKDRGVDHTVTLTSEDVSGPQVNLELLWGGVSETTTSDASTPITTAYNPGFFIANQSAATVTSWNDEYSPSASFNPAWAMNSNVVLA